MNQVLQPFIGKFLVAYIGNILIYRKAEDNHVFHLQQAMRVIWWEKLYINLKNVPSWPLVSAKGSEVGSDKVQAILVSTITDPVTNCMKKKPICLD